MADLRLSEFKSTQRSTFVLYSHLYFSLVCFNALNVEFAASEIGR